MRGNPAPYKGLAFRDFLGTGQSAEPQMRKITLRQVRFTATRAKKIALIVPRDLPCVHRPRREGLHRAKPRRSRPGGLRQCVQWTSLKCPNTRYLDAQWQNGI